MGLKEFHFAANQKIQKRPDQLLSYSDLSWTQVRDARWLGRGIFLGQRRRKSLARIMGGKKDTNPYATSIKMRAIWRQWSRSCCNVDRTWSALRDASGVVVRAKLLVSMRMGQHGNLCPVSAWLAT